MLSKAAWGVESEGFLLTVIALIFGTMLFYAVPSAGLLFRGGETIPKIFLGLVMLTLLTHLCWRWALARVVLPLRAESSSSLVFKGGCSWPGLHCVGSFPGIQLMKFGFFFKSFLFIIYDLTVTEMCGYLRNTMSVCFHFWNLRSESETRSGYQKMHPSIFSVYFHFVLLQLLRLSSVV